MYDADYALRAIKRWRNANYDRLSNVSFTKWRLCNTYIPVKMRSQLDDPKNPKAWCKTYINLAPGRSLESYEIRYVLEEHRVSYVDVDTDKNVETTVTKEIKNGRVIEIASHYYRNPTYNEAESNAWREANWQHACFEYLNYDRVRRSENDINVDYHRPTKAWCQRYQGKKSESQHWLDE